MSSIILNCTPPYSPYIPNPALGYLKGFLEARGVPVTNVYWNVILYEKLVQFEKGLEKYTQNNTLLSVFPSLYGCRQLLAQDYPTRKVTPLDLFYSSIHSREEIAEMTHSIREYIDRHVQQHNLHKAALSGFTLKTHQWFMGYYLSRRFKELNPDIKIVIGGIANKERALTFMQVFNHVDFAIHGEGEYPLFYLAKAVEEDEDFENVPNLVYRKGKHIISTDTVQECPPLDEYPFADHSDCIHTFKEHVSQHFFSAMVRVFEGSPSDHYPVMIPIWGSRSCPWNKCRFCVLNENYSYRARSPENVVEEIEYQSGMYGVDSFIFVDTELPGTMNRFKMLLKLLMKSVADRGRKYRMVGELSPIFVTPETARYMERISFTEIQIGFEAMTDLLLKKMEKRHRFAHNIQALKLANQYRLYMGGLNIIRGIPTETTEDIVESCRNVRFLRFLFSKNSLNPDYLQLERGAPFYDDVPEEEREKWRNNPLWEEIESINLIPKSDRFEFFGFSNSTRNQLWDTFERLLEYYSDEHHCYEWIEYSHGSFIEEGGPRPLRYTLDRDETDVLIFCDTVRTFPEIQERLNHLSEETLSRILQDLKRVGLLYCDEDVHHVISVVEATRKKVLEYE